MEEGTNVFFTKAREQKSSKKPGEGNILSPDELAMIHQKTIKKPVPKKKKVLTLEEQMLALAEPDPKKEKKKVERKPKKDIDPDERCHICRALPEVVDLYKCEMAGCPKKYCFDCLKNKYELIMKGKSATKKKTSKNEPIVVDDEDSEDEISDKDSKVSQKQESKPEPEKKAGPKWRCPACSSICVCNPCRKRQNKPPISSVMAEIKKQAKGFASLWDYFEYCRDNAVEKKPEEKEEESEEEEEAEEEEDDD
eukprot:TRINITY_DN2431_c0_g1_i2.p1 TRINITY_DN2431_c0_g1~~TRINITY_DN2431_c0_g1_i2.p1  ORF type:complete len:290 (+),score=113.84 TRINITY_DN2431_c0_g1_i2:117-872(+)